MSPVRHRPSGANGNAANGDATNGDTITSDDGPPNRGTPNGAVGRGVLGREGVERRLLLAGFVVSTLGMVLTPGIVWGAEGSHPNLTIAANLVWLTGLGLAAAAFVIWLRRERREWKARKEAGEVGRYRERPLVFGLLALGVVGVVVGALYLGVDAGDLPAFLPGQTDAPELAGYRYRARGAALVGLSGIALVVAWQVSVTREVWRGR